MKPILFNTDMVRAILDGQKTVTRRAVKPQPQYCHMSAAGLVTSEQPIEVINGLIAAKMAVVHNVPYSEGDILYVRETWTCMRDINTGHCDYFYAANQKDYDTVSSTYLCDDDGFDTGKPFPWKSSIHMPKEIARIFLRVTDVRVERLQDCGNAQAKDEGCTCCSQFARVWDSTIKPADLPQYGWEANPWVWAIGFERIDAHHAKDL